MICVGQYKYGNFMSSGTPNTTEHRMWGVIWLQFRVSRTDFRTIGEWGGGGGWVFWGFFEIQIIFTISSMHILRIMFIFVYIIHGGIVSNPALRKALDLKLKLTIWFFFKCLFTLNPVKDGKMGGGLYIRGQTESPAYFVKFVKGNNGSSLWHVNQ